MKWSDFTIKQKLIAVLAVLGIAFTIQAFETPKKAPKKLISKVLFQSPKNIGLLVSDPKLLTETKAKAIAKEYCNGSCWMVYFYATSEAYDLHMYKRAKFTNPEKQFNGDVKKMVRAQDEWMKTDNNWKNVQENVLALVENGEYRSFPLK